MYPKNQKNAGYNGPYAVLGIGSMCGRFPYIDVPFKKVTKYIYPIWCKLLRGTTNGCPDVVQARVIGYDVVSDPRDPTTF